MVVNPPTNLLCEKISDTLVITWDASTSAGITEYRIHVYNGSTIEKEAFVSQLSYMYIMPGTGTYSVHIRALITRTNYSAAVISICDGSGGSGGGGSGTCSGTLGPVTGLKCTISGSTVSASWTAPAGGTYDKFRVHYYIGTTYTEHVVTTTSDTYTSSAITSIHVRSMCGTAVSSTVIATCTSDGGGGGGGGGCVSTGYNCESGQTGYEVDNCGNRRANSACGTGGGCVSTGVYNCEAGQTGYEVDNCGTRRANIVCNPVDRGTTCGVGQINLFGSCYKTSNVMIVGVGIVGLFILMR